MSTKLPRLRAAQDTPEDIFEQLYNEIDESRRQDPNRRPITIGPSPGLYDAYLQQQIQQIASAGDITQFAVRRGDFQKQMDDSSGQPDAVELYVGIAGEILRHLDARDSEATAALRKVINFLVSNARVSPLEVQALRSENQKLASSVQELQQACALKDGRIAAKQEENDQITARYVASQQEVCSLRAAEQSLRADVEKKEALAAELERRLAESTKRVRSQTETMAQVLREKNALVAENVRSRGLLEQAHREQKQLDEKARIIRHEAEQKLRQAEEAVCAAQTLRCEADKIKENTKRDQADLRRELETQHERNKKLMAIGQQNESTIIKLKGKIAELNARIGGQAEEMTRIKKEFTQQSQHMLKQRTVNMLSGRLSNASNTLDSRYDTLSRRNSSALSSGGQLEPKTLSQQNSAELPMKNGKPQQSDANNTVQSVVQDDVASGPQSDTGQKKGEKPLPSVSLASDIQKQGNTLRTHTDARYLYAGMPENDKAVMVRAHDSVVYAICKYCNKLVNTQDYSAAVPQQKDVELELSEDEPALKSARQNAPGAGVDYNNEQAYHNAVTDSLKLRGEALVLMNQINARIDFFRENNIQMTDEEARRIEGMQAQLGELANRLTLRDLERQRLDGTRGGACARANMVDTRRARVMHNSAELVVSEFGVGGAEKVTNMGRAVLDDGPGGTVRARDTSPPSMQGGCAVQRRGTSPPAAESPGMGRRGQLPRPQSAGATHTGDLGVLVGCGRPSTRAAGATGREAAAPIVRLAREGGGAPRSPASPSGSTTTGIPRSPGGRVAEPVRGAPGRAEGLRAAQIAPDTPGAQQPPRSVPAELIQGDAVAQQHVRRHGPALYKLKNGCFVSPFGQAVELWRRRRAGTLDMHGLRGSLDALERLSRMQVTSYGAERQHTDYPAANVVGRAKQGHKCGFAIHDGDTASHARPQHYMRGKWKVVANDYIRGLQPFPTVVYIMDGSLAPHGVSATSIYTAHTEIRFLWSGLLGNVMARCLLDNGVNTQVVGGAQYFAINTEIREKQYAVELAHELVSLFAQRVLSSFDQPVDFQAQLVSYFSIKFGIIYIKYLVQCLANIVNYRSTAQIVELAFMIVFDRFYSKRLLYFTVFMYSNTRDGLSARQTTELFGNIFYLPEADKKQLEKELHDEFGNSTVHGEYIVARSHNAMLNSINEFENTLYRAYSASKQNYNELLLEISPIYRSTAELADYIRGLAHVMDYEQLCHFNEQVQYYTALRNRRSILDTSQYLYNLLSEEKQQISQLNIRTADQRAFSAVLKRLEVADRIAGQMIENKLHQMSYITLYQYELLIQQANLIIYINRTQEQ